MSGEHPTSCFRLVLDTRAAESRGELTPLLELRPAELLDAGSRFAVHERLSFQALDQ